MVHERKIDWNGTSSRGESGTRKRFIVFIVFIVYDAFTKNNSLCSLHNELFFVHNDEHNELFLCSLWMIHCVHNWNGRCRSELFCYKKMIHCLQKIQKKNQKKSDGMPHLLCQFFNFFIYDLDCWKIFLNGKWKTKMEDAGANYFFS